MTEKAETFCFACRNTLFHGRNKLFQQAKQFQSACFDLILMLGCNRIYCVFADRKKSCRTMNEDVSDAIIILKQRIARIKRILAVADNQQIR